MATFSDMKVSIMANSLSQKQYSQLSELTRKDQFYLDKNLSRGTEVWQQKGVYHCKFALIWTFPVIFLTLSLTTTNDSVQHGNSPTQELS